MDRMDPKSPLYEENSPKILMAGHYDAKYPVQPASLSMPSQHSHPLPASSNSPSYTRNVATYPVSNNVLYGRPPPSPYLIHLTHDQNTSPAPLDSSLVTPIPKRLSAPEIPTISHRNAEPIRSFLPRKLSVPEVPLTMSSFSSHTKPPTVSIQGNSEGNQTKYH
jgi:hypothetical protein